MPKVRVSEATNLQLDWMVAKAIALLPQLVHGRGAVRAQGYAQKLEYGYQFYVLRNTFLEMQRQCEGAPFHSSVHIWTPTTAYEQAGPIIDREEINLNIHDGWWATMIRPGGCFRQHGPERLVAAMRCYVASKLGGVVEVPEGIC